MDEETDARREARGDKTPPPAGEASPWALAGLGMQFFAAIILFVYAGAWLDRRVGSSPLFLLAGLFLGGGGTFYVSYRRLTGPADRAQK